MVLLAFQRYPDSLSACSVDEFKAGMTVCNAAMEERNAKAKAEGCVLRYVASISEKELKVGMKAIPAGTSCFFLRYEKNKDANSVLVHELDSVLVHELDVHINGLPTLHVLESVASALTWVLRHG